PAPCPVDDLALADVDPGPHLDSNFPYRVDDLSCASDGACRPVESGEEAVAGGGAPDALPPRERGGNDGTVSVGGRVAAKRGNEPVAGGAAPDPLPPRERGATDGMVSLDELLPRPIPDRRLTL